jgi:ribosomal protein S18 acetylase RimI-like enzyme
MGNIESEEEVRPKGSALFAAYLPKLANRPREPIPDALQIREGELRDVEALGRLFGHREGLDYQEAEARVRRWFDLPAGPNLLLVADNAGELVGYGRAAFLAKPQLPGFEHVPAGWYLTGVIVDERFRRRGIGELLTERRLSWIFERAKVVYFFANSLNFASIDLHRRLGFEELQRGFSFPGAVFAGGGGGILYRALAKQVDRGA